MKKQVRIKTKTNKIIVRNADVRDFLNNDGTVTSYASVGKTEYTVIDRDIDGAIFGLKK